jgi:hypothetical protein
MKWFGRFCFWLAASLFIFHRDDKGRSVIYENTFWSLSKVHTLQVHLPPSRQRSVKAFRQQPSTRPCIQSSSRQRMSRSITISYDLRPPPNTPAPNLTPTKSQEFPVKNVAEGQKSYYESLRGSIGEAKTVLGEELTAWRDAVGKEEHSKESKKAREDGDDEAEEDED